MLALDTNVVLRVWLEDNAREAALARELIEQETVFISSYVLLEFVWVLRTQGRSRSAIAEALETLLESPGVIIGQREWVAEALARYREGKADFADYVIAAEAAQQGADLLSFDATLCKEGLAARP